MNAPKHYRVAARKRDKPTIRVNLMGTDPAQVISTMQELYPDYLISFVDLAPEWEDIS